MKQAVISASAPSLLYPGDGIDGYGRDEFLADLVAEAEPTSAAASMPVPTASRSTSRRRGSLSVAASLRPGRRVFVGVTDPIDPEVEEPLGV